ncbi:hypothetical protein ACH79_06540 [Bradyrhizobium sp. CCBAU 051011]|nr:hypothetical protein ACH79_06540 [Bradyrhizobium sp. CCBAU 051011]
MRDAKSPLLVKCLGSLVNPASKSQVSEALEMVCKLLRAHADAVIAGLAPATLPQPDNSALAQAHQPSRILRIDRRLSLIRPTKGLCNEQVGSSELLSTRL